MDRAALVLLACAAIVGSVSAHGGSLHDWKFTDAEHKHLPRYTVAAVNASTFTQYNADMGGAYAPGPIPFWNTTKSMAITGSIWIVNYLDDGCRETVALAPSLTLEEVVPGKKPGKKTSKPIKSTKVYAYGMTGNCTQAGDLYRGNLTMGTTRMNLLWWRDGVTDNKGYLWGSSPNIFTIRAPANDSDTTGLRSIILVTQNYPIMCAPIKKIASAPKGWANKVKNCVVNPNAGAYHGK